MTKSNETAVKQDSEAPDLPEKISVKKAAVAKKNKIAAVKTNQ